MNDREIRLQALRMARDDYPRGANPDVIVSRAEEYVAFLSGDKSHREMQSLRELARAVLSAKEAADF